MKRIAWKYTHVVRHFSCLQNQKISHKLTLNKLGEQLGYKTLDDWYNISREILQMNGGGTLLSENNYSVIQTLRSVYPQHEWVEWRFSQVPLGFWEDANNHMKYLDWLGRQLGYKTMEDWYKITQELINKHGGSGLLHSHFGSSPYVMLQTLHPDYEWIPWKFISHTPNKYWKDTNNQRKYLNWLAEQLEYKTMEDWYKITQEAINKHGGRGLLYNYYNNSPILMLQTLFPTFHWIPWKFSYVPNRFWKDPRNQLKFMEWLGTQLKYKTMEDWYQITTDVIIKHGGGGLMNGCNNSAVQLLQRVYPAYDWIPWKFAHVQVRLWRDRNTQLKFLEWLSSQLGYKSMEDWYHITPLLIRKHGGKGLLSNYNHSISQMFQTLYPSHEWKIEHFRN